MQVAKVVVPTAEDLTQLTKAVKAAATGTGAVARIMDSASFKLCPRGLTRVIMGCRNSRQWAKAMEILQLARDGTAGLPKPNFFAFSAAISVCCRSRRVSETIFLLREMSRSAAQDPSLAPDSVVYRLVVSCCVKEGDHVKALEVFGEMSEGGIMADDQTLVLVLKALTATKQWERAVEVMDGVHGRGRVLSIQQYNQIIGACIMDGDVDNAIEVFLMMQMVGVDVDTYTCDHIMTGMHVAQCPHMALDFLDSMQKCGQTVLPRTCGKLLRVVVDSDRLDFLPRLAELFNKQCPPYSIESQIPERNARTVLKPSAPHVRALNHHIGLQCQSLLTAVNG